MPQQVTVDEDSMSSSKKVLFRAPRRSSVSSVSTESPSTRPLGISGMVPPGGVATAHDQSGTASSQRGGFGGDSVFGLTEASVSLPLFNPAEEEEVHGTTSPPSEEEQHHKKYGSPRARVRRFSNEVDTLARSFSKKFEFGTNEVSQGQKIVDRVMALDAMDEELDTIIDGPSLALCAFTGINVENPSLPRTKGFQSFPFTSSMVSEGVEKIRANESTRVQNQFTDGVEEMLMSTEFHAIMEAMMWYLILTIQQKYGIAGKICEEHATPEGRDCAFSASSETTPKPHHHHSKAKRHSKSRSKSLPSISVTLRELSDQEMTELRKKTLFHVVAMNYGHMYSTMKIPPMSGTRIMDYKERIMQVLPVIVPKTVYYLASTIFIGAEDERKFDKALRGSLQSTFSYWAMGVVPQQINLNNWVKFTRSVNIKKHKEFNATSLANAMEQALGPDKKPVTKAAPNHGLSGSGGASTTKGKGRHQSTVFISSQPTIVSSTTAGSWKPEKGGKKSASTTPASATPAFARSPSTAQLIPPTPPVIPTPPILSSTPHRDTIRRDKSHSRISMDGSATPTERRGTTASSSGFTATDATSKPKTPRKEKPHRTPTLRHATGNSWYECGAVRGHLTVERMNEVVPEAETLSIQGGSPLMRHYLTEMRVDVAHHGVERAITWTKLSDVDAKGSRFRFSDHADKIGEVGRKAVVDSTKGHEAITEGERRDVVVGQRSTRFWTGKAKMASEMLSSMYSPLHPTNKALYDDLMDSMQHALEPRPNIVDYINNLTTVLLRVQENMFTVPMPRRHRVQLLSIVCYKKLKALERKLPAILDAKETVFGETVDFDQDSLRQLDDLFSTLSTELEKQKDEQRQAGAPPTTQQWSPIFAGRKKKKWYIDDETDDDDPQKQFNTTMNAFVSSSLGIENGSFDAPPTPANKQEKRNKSNNLLSSGTTPQTLSPQHSSGRPSWQAGIDALAETTSYSFLGNSLTAMEPEALLALLRGDTPGGVSTGEEQYQRLLNSRGSWIAGGSAGGMVGGLMEDGEFGPDHHDTDELLVTMMSSEGNAGFFKGSEKRSATNNQRQPSRGGGQHKAIGDNQTNNIGHGLLRTPDYVTLPVTVPPRLTPAAAMHKQAFGMMDVGKPWNHQKLPQTGVSPNVAPSPRPPPQRAQQAGTTTLPKVPGTPSTARATPSSRQGDRVGSRGGSMTPRGGGSRRGPGVAFGASPRPVSQHARAGPPLIPSDWVE